MRFSALRNICRCVFCLSVCLSFALGGKYTGTRALALYCSLMEKNTCMHAPAADVCIWSLKGATRSDVISNVYVLPGARLRGRRSSPAPSVRGCRTLQLSMSISAGSPPLYAEGGKKRRWRQWFLPKCARSLFSFLRPC